MDSRITLDRNSSVAAFHIQCSLWRCELNTHCEQTAYARTYIEVNSSESMHKSCDTTPLHSYVSALYSHTAMCKCASVHYVKGSISQSIERAVGERYRMSDIGAGSTQINLGRP